MAWIAIRRMWSRWFGARPSLAAGHARPLSKQRLIGDQADRWGRMLKALQIAPNALLPALGREMAKGVSESERLIEPRKERLFFDGLIVGRKIDALDRLCSELDAGAITDRVMGKIPSLRDWAIGALTDDALLRAKNAETVAWARDTGRFAQGVLREAYLAEAIESGSSELARRELGDAGLERLEAGQMSVFMEAFAERKEGGLSSGLDAKGLEAFAQSLGGWPRAIEGAAGLGHEALMDLIDDLLAALQEEGLLESKVFERARASASKKTRETIAKAIALQAAKSNRPAALLAAVSAMADARGQSHARVAEILMEGARVKVGAMDVPARVPGGVSLGEVAKLSNAPLSQKVLSGLLGARAEPDPERLKTLVAHIEKSVRGMAMRSSGSARESTKAWRETVKAWKRGLLGSTSLAQMHALVQERAGPHKEGKPKGPSA